MRFWFGVGGEWVAKVKERMEMDSVLAWRRNQSGGCATVRSELGFGDDDDQGRFRRSYGYGVGWWCDEGRVRDEGFDG